MRVTTPPSAEDNPTLEGVLLIECLVASQNMNAAYGRVMKNKGAAGVDRMPVSELKSYVESNWLKLKAELLSGNYKPGAVLQVEIPKPGGGVRKLGIPTVTDRLIQQGLLQILSPIFEPGFSGSSFGFRPGLSAQDAVKQSQRYIREGYSWVVDMDLEKFFDEVPHDILMGRVRRKVSDKSVLKLVRGYLEAEVEVDGKGYRRQKRSSARWSTFAAVGQYPAGRPGQRVGETWSSVLPLCRRLQHLRSERKGGETGQRIVDWLAKETSGAKSERRKERSRSGVETEFSGLYFSYW